MARCHGRATAELSQISGATDAPSPLVASVLQAVIDKGHGLVECFSHHGSDTASSSMGKAFALGSSFFSSMGIYMLCTHTHTHILLTLLTLLTLLINSRYSSTHATHATHIGTGAAPAVGKRKVGEGVKLVVVFVLGAVSLADAHAVKVLVCVC